MCLAIVLCIVVTVNRKGILKIPAISSKNKVLVSKSISLSSQLNCRLHFNSIIIIIIFNKILGLILQWMVKVLTSLKICILLIAITNNNRIIVCQCNKVLEGRWLPLGKIRNLRIILSIKPLPPKTILILNRLLVKMYATLRVIFVIRYFHSSIRVVIKLNVYLVIPKYLLKWLSRPLKMSKSLQYHLRKF